MYVFQVHSRTIHRGLVLQDLTFVHIGNPDKLPDGNINFSKRWQQFHILNNMKRFRKWSVMLAYRTLILPVHNEPTQTVLRV